MIRDPYTRQIRQHVRSACGAVAVSALLSAGSAQLIADAQVGATAGVSAVVTIAALGLTFAVTYVRDAAGAIARLREQQASWRIRSMHRRTHPRVQELPDLDPLEEAHNRRAVEGYEVDTAQNAAARTVDPPTPPPTVGYTVPFPPMPITGVRWGFDGDSPTVGPLPEPAGGRR